MDNVGPDEKRASNIFDSGSSQSDARGLATWEGDKRAEWGNISNPILATHTHTPRTSSHTIDVCVHRHVHRPVRVRVRVCAHMCVSEGLRPPMRAASAPVQTKPLNTAAS